MTCFHIPDTLHTEIHEWCCATGITPSFRTFSQRDGEHYITFTHDNDAMMFKMRWHDEVEYGLRQYSTFGPISITYLPVKERNVVAPPKKLHGPEHTRKRWER
jgi:hypothetical protein